MTLSWEIFESTELVIIDVDRDISTLRLCVLEP